MQYYKLRLGSAMVEIPYNMSQLNADALDTAFFFCKRVDGSKSKMEPAANTVAIVAFKIHLTSTAVS